jgi:hypothetical protein
MRAILLATLLMPIACGPGQVSGGRDTGLDGLTLMRVDPGLVLPGTRVVITGKSFVDDSLGATRLKLAGTLRGADIDVALDAKYVSATQLEIIATPDVASALGGLSGSFDGTAKVEVDSTVDNLLHASQSIPVVLQLATQSTPSLDGVGDGLSFVNQPVEMTGMGFLLGGMEGETRARLSGCFTPMGMATCGPNVSVEIAAVPATTFDRTRAAFPYATSISGIGPGTFTGTLVLVNVHAGGPQVVSKSRPVSFDIQKPAILSASTTAASLGQYVVINGGGFVGGAADEVTLLAVQGMFMDDATGKTRVIDVQLVPEFVSGPQVRYVLDDTDDPLGQAIDLRKESGKITGTAKPIITKGAARVEGNPVAVVLSILPVNQVVWVNFLPSFVGSLRRFGLRAADPQIRARVLEVSRRDYTGANVEFRETRPTDFALFAEVDIAGPDPNGLGLLGYDNSPGKDTDNRRLYDKIGGVNATTQQDGYPGFGGVFTESFFGFSQHPNGLAQKLPQPSETFDRIFDPFRADRGGRELTATELANEAPPMLMEGSSCPASDRRGQIACAIFVLGNLIGTTMTHEVGHSLGLANPYGEGFHDPGDQPSRLMDAGGDRPFDERAELGGLPPAVFCDEEFDYLRMILPSKSMVPAISRPTCF